MSTARSVLKNFLSLIFADFINKALAFLGVAYLARVLKAEGFGKIEFAQAIIIYFFVVANQGLSVLGTREIAKDKARIKTYVDQILTMRLLLSLVSYVLLVVFVLWINQPTEVKRLLLIYGFTLFTFSLTLDWVFQGMEKMEYVALVRITNQVVYVGGLFILVKNGNHLLRVPILRVIAAGGGAIILLYTFIQRYSGIKLRCDINLWKQIFRESVPMGISAIMIQLYFSFDSVMLGFMKGVAEVGWYNAAYKIVLLLIGFVTLFGTTIFPVLSRYYQESLAKLSNFVFQSSRLTIFFGLPIAVGGTILSAQIIQLVYGPSYQASILPLQILIWSVFTSYFNCSFAFCLLACDKQKEFMYSVIAGAIVNLILNFMLIPKYSMLGASIATIGSEVITLGLILLYSRKIVKAIPGIDMLKILGASACMGVALYFLPGNLLIKACIGVFVYLCAMITLRGIKGEDVIWLKRIIQASYE